MFLARPEPGRRGGGLIPGFDGCESVLLAAGILGATVMPHVIYLHSALTQRRVVGDERARRSSASCASSAIDVIIAMVIAGAINLSMLLIGAAVFHASGPDRDLVARRGVPRARPRSSGSHADVVFGIALLASGLSSSSVGTMAGQVVMQGFIQRRIPLFLRRAITMAPALIVIAIGVERDVQGADRQPGRALVRDPVRARSRSSSSRATAR